MTTGEATDPEGRIEVRFSGLGSGCVALMLAPFPGLLATLPGSGIHLLLAVSCGLIAAYGLTLIVATYWRLRPIMIVAPEGIYLPIAGDEFLSYDRVEVWTEMLGVRRPCPWAFSLQSRPRTWLDMPWWTRIWMVRANTSVRGDLVLDERFISVRAKPLAAAIEARRAAVLRSIEA